MEQIEVYEYQLKNKLVYANDEGANATATFLELREPTSVHSTECFKLEQMIGGLMVGAQEKRLFNGEADENTLAKGTGEQVKELHDQDLEDHVSEAEQMGKLLPVLFGASQDISLSNFIKIFGKMAVNSTYKSICRVDAKVPMTRPLWDKLSPADAKGVTFAYCTFFVLPSFIQD